MPKSESAFLDFVRTVVGGPVDEVSRRLAADPSLATVASDVGATRRDAATFFFDEIAHYLYAGDTALHMAAAAYEVGVARELVSKGANVRARNRRGAEPLHYAADGAPGSPAWDPDAGRRSSDTAWWITIRATPRVRNGVAPPACPGSLKG